MTNRHWELLVGYVTGELSRREEEEVRAMIAIDPEKGELLDELEQVWAATEPSGESVQSQRAWEALRAMRDRYARIIPLPGAARPASVRRKRPSQFFRVAAVLAAVAAVIVIMFEVHVAAPTQTPVAEPEPRVFETGPGQRALITLLDSTQVRLNVDSKLTVFPSFGDTTREVALEGEAFFDVAGDTGRPFRVTTDAGTVEVHGTSFDVRMYRDESSARVVVAEGLVSLRPSRGASKDSVLLEPNDMAAFTPDGDTTVRRRISLTNYLAWTQGRLVFTNSSFAEVITELERWYRIDVDTKVPVDRVVRLTASFGEEPLGEILNIIAETLNLQYERDRRQVTFYTAAENKL